MNNVGYATLQVIPSMRGVRSRIQREASDEIGPALEKAGDDAGDRGGRAAERSFGRRMGSLGKTVTVGLGAALGVGAAAAGAWGISLAAENEQAAVAFEGMLGDAQKAQSFIGEMRDFAAKTPFELPGLQNAARQLLGVGFAAEEVLPTLGTIGDLAATLGVGEDAIQSVIRALGQMQGKGRASAEELQQISEAVPGFSAIGAIATSMGISTAEAFKRMESGAIPADVAIQSVLSGMERFPGAAGAMERQSQTLSGMLSTLKDTLGQGLATVMQPVVEGLKTAMPALTDTISQIMTTLGPVIATALGSFLGVISELLPVLAPILEALGGAFAKALDGLGPILEQLAPFISDFASQLGDALGSSLQVLLPALGQLLVALAPLLPIFADIASTLLAALVPVIAELATALAPVITELIEGFRPVLAQLLPMIPQLTAAFLPLIPPLGRLLVALVPLIPLFLTLTERILVQLLPVLIPIIEKMVTFAAVMIDKLVPAVTAVVGWITRLFDAIFDQDWDAAKEMLFGWIGDIPEKIRGLASGMWDGIKDAFKSAVNWIIRAWNDLSLTLPSVDTPFGKVGGFTLDTPNIPEFHSGGIVPGRGGEEVLALLQAGEMVLPRSTVASGAVGGAPLGQVVQHFHGADSRKLARDAVFELKAASLLAVPA